MKEEINNNNIVGVGTTITVMVSSSGRGVEYKRDNKVLQVPGETGTLTKSTTMAMAMAMRNKSKQKWH